jgi:broad specificity phosphatase PhoE
MAAREIVLVRHAETVASVEGRYLGWTDAPLTPAGRAAAASLGDRIGRADLVVSSDLPRALETARLALPDAVVEPDARLRELSFGTFEGRTYEENLGAHGRLFRDWIDDPYAVRPPGGELLGELETRVAAWLAALPPTGRVVAFTHAGAMHALQCHVRNERFDAQRATRFGYCDVVRLVVDAAAADGRVAAPGRDGE